MPPSREDRLVHQVAFLKGIVRNLKKHLQAKNKALARAEKQLGKAARTLTRSRQQPQRLLPAQQDITVRKKPAAKLPHVIAAPYVRTSDR